MVVDDDFGYLKIRGKLNLGHKEREEDILSYNVKAAGLHMMLWRRLCCMFGFGVKLNPSNKMKCLTGSQVCTAGMPSALTQWAFFFKAQRRENEKDRGRDGQGVEWRGESITACSVTPASPICNSLT